MSDPFDFRTNGETMNNVEIRAMVKGELISGVYPLISSDEDTFIVRHPRHGLVKLPMSAKVIAHKIGKNESGVSTKKSDVSYPDLVKDIHERFKVLDRMIDGVIAKNIRSLIVSGATGVGKTHSIDTKLTAGRREGKVRRYLSNRGTISPIGLYILLYKHCNPGDVLVLDDCDNVFKQLDAVNILKAALDTGEKRFISYAKEAYGLVDQGIPSRFEFRGAVIFASNIDFDTAIESGNDIAPHLRALIARSLYVDLGLHSKQSLMARVEDVCYGSDMLKKEGLSESQIMVMVQWLKDNMDSLRTLSLHTAKQLAGLVKTSENWRADARVTLLKPKKV